MSYTHSPQSISPLINLEMNYSRLSRALGQKVEEYKCLGSLALIYNTTPLIYLAKFKYFKK